MLNHCTATLVGCNLLLPTDPSSFSNGLPSVGCNHIVCVDCENAVVAVENRGVSSIHVPSGSEPASLLLSGPAYEGTRAYFCRCAWMEVTGSSQTHAGDVERTSHIRWECAGHPDDDVGTRAARVELRGELFRQAMCVADWGGTVEAAFAAWELLQTVAGEDDADRANTMDQLMCLTHDATIRGRAAAALSRLLGDPSDARSVLSATIRNSNDPVAIQEAERLLPEFSSADKT